MGEKQMRNFIFISPNFPTNYWMFCHELKNNGINVLGIGDCPYDYLMPELQNSLTEYFKVDTLEDDEAVYRAIAFFIFKYGLCISSVKVHREKIGLDKMNVSVYSAALVPPALVVLGIYVNGKIVALAETNEVGDVNLEGGVAGEIALQKASVEVYCRLGCDALKIKGDALVSVALVKVKIFYVPAVVVGKIAEGGIELLLGNALNYEIVWQIHRLPTVCVVKYVVVAFVGGGDIVPACGAEVLTLGAAYKHSYSSARGHRSFGISHVEEPILVYTYLFSHKEQSFLAIIA
jgi:hypothetical protein